MIAGLAFVGCTNEEEIVPGNGTVSDGTPRFLRVSVNSVGSAQTRAGLEGTYEEGSGLENKVTEARFYFFDASGNAAGVKAGGNADSPTNYLDATPTEGGKDMNNVEKILSATLVISTKNGDKLPETILAVLNPTEEIKSLGSKSLSELQQVIADYSNTATAAGGFLMSNSVYAKESNKMVAVPVKAHIYKTETAALKDPVQIHVERVLAKARLTVDASLDKKELSDGTVLYKALKAKTTDAEKYDTKDIYVKFLGWNVTATTKKSRLMKEINTAWAADLFKATPWNTADYCRSFWAINPTELKVYEDYNYGKWSDAQAITEFDAGTKESPKENYTYMQENASDNVEDGSNPKNPSQVIIAAQLVDQDGNVLSIAEHGGKRMESSALKGYYADLCGLYKANSGGTGRVKMSEDDIQLYTDADEHGGVTQPGTDNRYRVYAKLADGVTKDWYGSSNETDTEKIDADVRLKGLGSSKVWEEGRTYYYFDIRHLNYTSEKPTAPGAFGVVRNHVYASNITKLYGLGTPVFDPEEVIYPEHPSDDESYIAAEIRILSWRVVNQNIDLEW